MPPRLLLGLILAPCILVLAAACTNSDDDSQTANGDATAAEAQSSAETPPDTSSGDPGPTQDPALFNLPAGYPSQLAPAFASLNSAAPSEDGSTIRSSWETSAVIADIVRFFEDAAAELGLTAESIESEDTDVDEHVARDARGETVLWLTLFTDTNGPDEPLTFHIIVQASDS